MGTPKHVKHEQGKLHKHTGGHEGGACLTGHCGKYQKLSCSYRWQAHEHSKSARTGIYEKYPLSKSDKKVETSAYRDTKRKLYPRGYGQKLALPTQAGDWHLAGPTRAGMKGPGGKSVPKGKNFTNWVWPYWHNSHHLIPKGTFNARIEAVQAPRVRKLIRQQLLIAKYNINHFKNVMILPQDKEVARVLKLPRHLILEDGAKTQKGAEYFDHKAYNAKVETHLNMIIDTFKADVQKPVCDPNDAELTKQALENLSDLCFASIQAFGMIAAGGPISDMPL